MQLIAQQSKNSYGSRRVSMALKLKGYSLGRCAARTFMRQAGIECKQRRRCRITTNSKHQHPIAGNVLNRTFDVQRPNAMMENAHVLVVARFFYYLWRLP
jgi:putative transposase